MIRAGNTSTAETNTPPAGLSSWPDAAIFLANSPKPVPSLLPVVLLQRLHSTRRATPSETTRRIRPCDIAVKASNSDAPRLPVLFGGTCSSVRTSDEVPQSRHEEASISASDSRVRRRFVNDVRQ